MKYTSWWMDQESSPGRVEPWSKSRYDARKSALAPLVAGLWSRADSGGVVGGWQAVGSLPNRASARPCQLAPCRSWELRPGDNGPETAAPGATTDRHFINELEKNAGDQRRKMRLAVHRRLRRLLHPRLPLAAAALAAATEPAAFTAAFVAAATLTTAEPTATIPSSAVAAAVAAVAVAAAVGPAVVDRYGAEGQGEGLTESRGEG